MDQTSPNLYFSHSSINHVGGNQYNINSADSKALDILKPAARSSYDVQGCMQGTREYVFQEINLWLEAYDSETPNVLWICGSPGSGKSAILSSLVSSLTKRRRLGSFFFFKRADANLGHPAALWRSVAHDLASFHPSLKESIVEFLSQPGFRDSDIRLHFECLIEEPLKNSNSHPAPPVIIIDALDECAWGDYRSVQRQLLLETLTRWPGLPRSLKLIVSSRDERVPKFFHDPLLCRKIILETGDRVSDKTHADVRSYFEQGLEDIRPCLALPSTWPGERAMNKLTERAAGLFIWASTVIDFLGERRGNPENKLKLILAGNLGRRSADIDILYQQVLAFSFEDIDDTASEMFQMVVGIIIVTKEPLCRDDIRQFLHILGRNSKEDDRQVDIIIYGLCSVLDTGDPLRIKHLSFAEFLINSNRCQDSRFVVDWEEQHRNLALACLRIMKAALRFNICRLVSSHVRNDDVGDLPQRIATFIPNHLSYACRFWAAHLCSTKADDENHISVLKEIREFLHVRLLYWLEVMSLAKEIQAASAALLMVARWIQAFDVELAAFARDASRFIANFHAPISQSAPHIYLSALPFSPRQSLVSQQFLQQFPDTISVINGGDSQWPGLLNVFTGHTGMVLSIAFSPDGKRVASGSSDASIREWDVETGQLASGPFHDHTGSVTSVAYSPDGTQIVSGASDGTVRVWDIKTCEIAHGPLVLDAIEVLSVAYSLTGEDILACSCTPTYCIWNITTGEALRRSLTFNISSTRVYWGLTGPDLDEEDVSFDSVLFHNMAAIDDIGVPKGGGTLNATSAAYSPDRTKVVFGVNNGMVIECDMISHRVDRTPVIIHKRAVTAVAYSPDQHHVASGSSDFTISVWNLQEYSAQFFQEHTGAILSVAYSPNGDWLVAGSADKTLGVWNTTTCSIEAGPFKCHAEACAVAYSPDGIRVISGSSDGPLYEWDVKSFNLGNPEAHTDGVVSVSYSPCGREIVSASPTKSLKVWDVESGTSVAHAFGGAFGGNSHCAAYSPDGKCVVFGTGGWIYERVLASGDEPRWWRYPSYIDLVTSVAYSPDGKRVASSARDPILYVGDMATMRPLKGHLGGVLSVAFSPDGRWIVSGSSDKTLRIWDAETGQSVGKPFEGHTNMVESVVYSPDGEHVASGSWDGTVRIWDVRTGMVVAGPFAGHLGEVRSVTYSPDGRRVASGSSDGTIVVWDIRTGEVVAGPFEAHAGEVRKIEYSPDGRSILSCSNDVVFYVWVVDADITAADLVSNCEPDIPSLRSSNHHLANLHSIGGSNVFASCRRPSSDGWACAPVTSASSKPSILFWVPPHLRNGLCDGQSLFIFGSPRTKVDLSRFVHGKAWTHCHISHPTAQSKIGRTP